MPVFRSLLFAPGNHARRVEKSLTLDADVVILDLEDAVAVAEKRATREKVVAAFQASRRALGYVRINAFDTPFCFEDLQVVVTRGVDGIVLPKVESPAQLVAVDWAIAALERTRGLAEGGIDLMPIVETGRGMAALRDIVRSGARVRRLSFGAGDYTLDVGMRWTLKSASSTTPAPRSSSHRARPGWSRRSIPCSSTSADPNRSGAPPSWPATSASRESSASTPSRWVRSTKCSPRPARRSPGPERYVAAFEEAEASGSASIQVDGYFIDYPIVEKARRTLRIAESIRNSAAPEPRRRAAPSLVREGREQSGEAVFATSGFRRRRVERRDTCSGSGFSLQARRLIPRFRRGAASAVSSPGMETAPLLAMNSVAPCPRRRRT